MTIGLLELRKLCKWYLYKPVLIFEMTQARSTSGAEWWNENRRHEVATASAVLYGEAWRNDNT